MVRYWLNFDLAQALDINKVFHGDCLDINKVFHGDCLDLVKQMPDDFVDIVCTSPPYWGQRTSNGGGLGVEADPRQYLASLVDRFKEIHRVLKSKGIMWVNLGDSYNTPVNWLQKDHVYSSLGKNSNGLSEKNSAYIKTRHKRKAFIDKGNNWLSYGNLLALPQRLIIELCRVGWIFRGEVIWIKSNPLPEGKCRRPHRSHEGIYLFAKNEDHLFQIKPPIKSVWEFPNEGAGEIKHFSRFPKELPRRCIKSYGVVGKDVLVFDPFSGSGTTGVVAMELGCSYVGFEIDPELALKSNNYFK
jgi:DNA modification methylase